MANKIRVREITIVEESGTFTSFFKKYTGKKSDYDFKGLTTLRRILSNEKARVLHVIKSKNPKSIYELARILGRDFKSVSNDVKLLEKFGFIDMVSEQTGNRKRLKPILAVDSIQIQIDI